MEGCVGLQAHATDSRIEFFEPPHRTDESAARTESCDKMRDAAGSLRPNFVRRGAIVRLPVRGITVLVRVKIFLRISRDDFMHFANRPVGAFIAGSDHQLRTKRREDALPLVRSAVRQAKLHGKTQRRADHCIGYAGITACRVNDGLAGP